MTAADSIMEIGGLCMNWKEFIMNRLMRIVYIVVLVLILTLSIFGMALAAAAETMP
jgi:hypothetical protein